MSNRKPWSGARRLGLLWVAVANSGCMLLAGGAAGAAGYAYSQGEVEVNYDADFSATWAATHEAVTGLGLAMVSETRDRRSGSIKCTTGLREKVRIEVEQEPAKSPTGPTQTEVGIRVGVFGNHPLSQQIHLEIAARLSSRTPLPALPSSSAHSP